MKFFILLIALTQVTFATSECPKLTGFFDCKDDDPGHGSMFMLLRQRKVTAGVEYTWHYFSKQDGTETELVVLGSEEGIYNENVKSFGVCRNLGFYLARDPHDISRAFRNSIDSDGSFVNSNESTGWKYKCDRLF